jgi:hypothetical protein
LNADIDAGSSALHRVTMPNTIVFTRYESNEGGDVLVPRMPNWPKEIRASIALSESGGTDMQFVWRPVDPTVEKALGWEASRSQHRNGWVSRVDMLVKYLSELSL